MIVHDVIQRSPAWRLVRLGRLTSSTADDMLAKGRDNKESAGRRNLRIRLALERVTGRSLDSGFMSAAMERGAEREADACALYEAITGRCLRTVGFVAHETLLTGCSPDGVFNDFEGLVEVKSPLPATHFEYLKTGVIPLNYKRQILHQLWITGAGWCDWLSFNPDFPEPLQTKLVRVERNDDDIALHEQDALRFLSGVDRETSAILTMADVGARLRLAATA